VKEKDKMKDETEFDYGPRPGGIIRGTKDQLAALVAMQDFHKDQDKVEEAFNVDSLDDALEDLVNHPNHYKSEGVSGIECIDAIQAALTEEEFQGFCKGNNIKYTWRANRKKQAGSDINSAGTNIKKAIWYMNKLLDSL
jgi:hypothetical protein